jgi:hypothetical protein
MFMDMYSLITQLVNGYPGTSTVLYRVLYPGTVQY